MARHLKDCPYVSDATKQNGNAYLNMPSKLNTIPCTSFYASPPPPTHLHTMPSASIHIQEVSTQLHPPHILRAMQEQEDRLQNHPQLSCLPRICSSLSGQIDAPAAWPKTRQEAQERQMLHTFISNGWAFLSADNPEFRKFMDGFQSGFRYPNRNKLSGLLLTAEFKATQDVLMKLQKGSYATGQCNSWKDISRNHLVAFMVTSCDMVCIRVFLLDMTLTRLNPKINLNLLWLGILTINTCATIRITHVLCMYYGVHNM